MGNLCCVFEKSLSKYNNNNVDEFNYEGLFRKCKVVNIYDGDTYRIVLFLNKKDKLPIKLKIRSFGCDTPELSPLRNKPNREREIKAAKKARNRFIQLATDQKIDINDDQKSKKEIQLMLNNNKKELYIELGKYEKYGRVLGKLYLDKNKKKNINEILVEEKYAVPYFGGKKK